MRAKPGHCWTNESGAVWCQDLARLHPQAKVILTVRDPVKWFQSVRSTIREIIRFRETLTFLPLRILQTILGSLPTNVSRLVVRLN